MPLSATDRLLFEAVATLIPLTEEVVHCEGEGGRLFFLLCCIEADITSWWDERLETAGEFISDDGLGVAGSEWLLPCDIGAFHLF